VSSSAPAHPALPLLMGKGKGEGDNQLPHD
jgi:hypothetical protein